MTQENKEVCHGASYGFMAPESTKWRFFDTDTFDLYEEHKDNPPDWFSRYSGNKEIIYHLNRHRFRSTLDYDKHKGECFFSIGDQFTAGIGIAHADIYSNIIERKLSYSNINLGVPNGAIETFYRLLKYWVPIKKPKFIILQNVNKSRREHLHKGHISTISEHDEFKQHNFSKLWDKEQNELNYEVYLKAIRQMCKKIPIITFDPLNFKQKNDYARDGINMGTKAHLICYDHLFYKIKEKQL